jgi:hypothetical protein
MDKPPKSANNPAMASELSEAEMTAPTLPLPNTTINTPEVKGFTNWLRAFFGFAVVSKTRWMIDEPKQVELTAGQTLSVAKLDGSTIINVPVDSIQDTFFSPIIGQPDQTDLIVRLKPGKGHGNPDTREIYAGTFRSGDPPTAPFKHVREFLKQHNLN